MDKYFTKTYQKILDLFIRQPTRTLNQREIASALSVSAMAISKNIEYLVDQGYLRKKEDNVQKKYSFNYENDAAITLKRIKNLERLFQSGLPQHLNETFSFHTTILIGSYQTGHDKEDSDIDIVFLGPEKQYDFSKFEEDIGKEIQTFFFKSFRNVPENLQEEVINGYVLTGHVNYD